MLELDVLVGNALLKRKMLRLRERTKESIDLKNVILNYVVI